MSAGPSFFAELQRRHVYKVGAAYCVAGWLLVQIVTQVFPIYDISARVQRIIVGLVMAGLPVALVLAWLFDITPQGIVRTADLPAGDGGVGEVQHRRGTDRRLNLVLGVLLLCSAGYILAERAGLVERSSGAGRAGDSTGAAEKSIAVLPFENLSDDKSNAFFADGIQDEILTRLSKIRALKVISRTSSKQYAAKPGNLPEIAHQLGVANLLEGSVQKVGNAVHINVQLIRAATDEHLWAESYNRKLDDVFAVEGEVAQTVADALQATLTPAEQQAVLARPTDNPAAYEAYQRGRAIESSSYSYPKEQQALEAFYEAVRLDPRFALAWAHAAITGSFLHFNGIDIPHSQPQAILLAADTAQRLQPELGEAWLAQGFYRYRVLRDPNGALLAFETAQQHLPNSAEVLSAIARVQRRLGNWDEAVRYKQKSIELDPRDAQILMEAGNELYGYLRRFDDARDVLNRALSIVPGDPTALCMLGQIEQWDGHLDEAARVLGRLPRDPAANDLQICWAPVTQALYERQWDRAIELLSRYVPPGDDALPLGNVILLAQFLATAQSSAGRDADARRTYARIVRSIRPEPDTPIPVIETEPQGVLAVAYAGLGNKAAALDFARQAMTIYRNDSIDRTWSLWTWAQVNAMLGDKDTAIAALPELLKRPAGLTPAMLRYDPIWDPLRSDPRFQRLMNEGIVKVSP